jgi:hypothetical protein
MSLSSPTSSEASSMGELSTTAPARPGLLRAVALPCSPGGVPIDARPWVRAPRHDEVDGDDDLLDEARSGEVGFPDARFVG